jgi:hypothetical protein
MTLSTVAVIVPQRPAMFELGVVHEVFGVDRTDDGVPPIDFRVCSEHPGEPIQMINGITITTSHGLADADDADLVVARLPAVRGARRRLPPGPRAWRLGALGLLRSVPAR